MLRRIILLSFILQLFSALLFAQGLSPADAAVLQWQQALAGGNMAAFADLYAKNPPVVIKSGKEEKVGAQTEVDFWNGIRNSGLKNLKAEVVELQQSGGADLATVHVSFVTNTPAGPRTRYVLYKQLWKQESGRWVIAMAGHTEVLKIAQPKKLNPRLYDESADARKEIAETVEKAKHDHKRIILVFGGNWCYDCHVLDTAFHQPDVAPLVDKNFYVIHVDIGRDGVKNYDLAAHYNTALNHGVPALAVLDSDGKLLFGQQHGEWEAARSMDPDVIVAFLNKWKPPSK